MLLLVTLVLIFAALSCYSFELSWVRCREARFITILKLHRDEQPVTTFSERTRYKALRWAAIAASYAAIALPVPPTYAEGGTASISSTEVISVSPSAVRGDVLQSTTSVSSQLDKLKVPYDHVNLPVKDFLGPKATIVFNMKIDDPQTVTQFPDLVEIYEKYKSSGLNLLAFPSEQGWFEPDDDETCRLKAKEYFKLGEYPRAVVFDKVDYLGPSANPFISALTASLPTPNGYSRITLNYEKFLLDANGNPVRRYPRKFSAYDMEADIKAVLNGQPLPAETPKYQKSWREAKREAVKSEYAFRYNYNYYNSPESMYKYNPLKDV